MRILLADDDRVARKVLDTFLRQSKHEVVVVEDGTSALQAMVSDDAPRVAVLDWMMPDISGLDLCRKLREHPFPVQPYLMILSGRQAKADIAEALDAGANDFLTKPFNIVETQARLRVAERAVAQQLALHRRIEEARAALDRHVELFEPDTAGAPAAESADPLAGFAALAPEATGKLLLRTLQTEISPQLVAAPAPAGSDPAPGRVLAWFGLLLIRENLWLDVLLETDAGRSATLFERSRGVLPAQPPDAANFCGEIHAAVAEALRAHLQAARLDVAAPFEVVVPGDAPTPFLRGLARRTGRTHRFAVADLHLDITLLATPSSQQSKHPEQLRDFDILGQPYPPMESN
ncbi:MAG TPA: response regulator transcription factor, partial [Opitutus sp.]|nr:response regulator transcription factor [Opitutus sp.]